MRSASRSPSTRSTAAASVAGLVEHLVDPAAQTALVLAQRACHRGLHAGRQDGGELARGATQLVDVPLRACEQRAQVGARRLARADAALAQFADAAQGCLARVPQWIVLRVFGVQSSPLPTARSLDHRQTRAWVTITTPSRRHYG